jgi:hypothetical protein
MAEQIEKMEVKIKFRKDEKYLWEMVSSHTCMSGFIKDVLKYYHDNVEQTKSNTLSTIDLSGMM